MRANCYIAGLFYLLSALSRVDRRNSSQSITKVQFSLISSLSRLLVIVGTSDPFDRENHGIRLNRDRISRRNTCRSNILLKKGVLLARGRSVDGEALRAGSVIGKALAYSLRGKSCDKVARLVCKKFTRRARDSFYIASRDTGGCVTGSYGGPRACPSGLESRDPPFKVIFFSRSLSKNQGRDTGRSRRPKDTRSGPSRRDTSRGNTFPTAPRTTEIAHGDTVQVSRNVCH